MEEDTARPLAQHHRQLAGRRRAGVEHPQRPVGGLAGHRLGGEVLEQFEADGPARALEAALQAAVAQRRAGDHEPGADPVVVDQQPVGVGDPHPLAGVGVGGRHLADGTPGRPGGFFAQSRVGGSMRASCSSRVVAGAGVLLAAVIAAPGPVFADPIACAAAWAWR